MKRGDHFVLEVNEHKVLRDRLQLIVQHPVGCTQRGSRLDRGKTFHPLKWIFEDLDKCGVVLTEEQEAEITRVGIECREAKR